MTIHHIYQIVFKIWRKRRFYLFLNKIEPRLTDILLDVGGYPDFWINVPCISQRIDILNIHPIHLPPHQTNAHHFQFIEGNGCALAMNNNSYDVCFSNSVIEHVGTWSDQQNFAAEIRRVGNALWIQTPAYECPIEPHYLALFVHYFPRCIQKKVLRWISVWGWVQRPLQPEIDAMVESIRLLTKSQMIVLFPDCTIITERMLGIFPKSYIAFRTRKPV